MGVPSESSQSEVSEEMPSARPVRRAERIISLDLIRGIAVLGILLANIVGFAQGSLAYYWPPAIEGGATQSDGIFWLLQLVLVDGKFRGIFTILFGAGMLLFMDRIADKRRARFLQIRRLVWLIPFGLLHFYFLYVGDILFAYACAGFFALLFARMEARHLIAIGLIWATSAALLDVLTYAPSAMIELEVRGMLTASNAAEILQEFWQQELANNQTESALIAGDSYFAILHYRFFEQSNILFYYFILGFTETIPLMLLGMGFYRVGMFEASDEVPHWLGIAIAGVVIGMLLNILGGVIAYNSGFQPFVSQFASFGLSPLGNVPMLAGGVALLAYWAARVQQGWLVERLSLAGRMAFTNYVGTSLVMVLIFQGWAGGLFGTLHRAELMLVVLMGWAMMLTGSRLWLSRFRYGPLEYLWRCLTYWRWFPLRK